MPNRVQPRNSTFSRTAKPGISASAAWIALEPALAASPGKGEDVGMD
jgi:hypothetical protein